MDSGNKKPRLQVVSRSGDQLRAADFDPALRIVPLTDLGGAERKRVERVVSQVSPGAEIIGASLSQRSWDVRPVVVIPSEAHLGPSLIRFLGPEVTLSIGLTARMTDLLRRLSTSRDSMSALLQWGVLEGQLWYRRAIVQRSLEEYLSVIEQPLKFAEGLDLALQISEAVQAWHARGVIHGHLVPTNVGWRGDGVLHLLDPGTALSVVQASYALGLEQLPAGYEAGSFAPECVVGEEISYAGDIYSFGQLLWVIFSRVRRAPQEEEVLDGSLENMLPEDLQLVKELITAMTDVDPHRRPSLQDVREILIARRQRRAEPIDRFNSRGVIVRTTRPTSSSPKNIDTKKESAVSIPSQLPSDVETQRTLADVQNQANSIPIVSNAHVSTQRDFGIQQPSQLTPSPREKDSFEEAVRFETPEPFTPHVPIEKPPTPESLSASGRQRIAVESLEPFVKSAVPFVRSILPGVVFILLLAGAYSFWNRFSFRGHDDAFDLETAWQSTVPSEMATVATVAVSDGPDQKVAERLVLRSAFNPEFRSDVVNTQLLRIAFDSRWEKKLSALDRKVVLILSLRKLLNEQSMPKTKISMETLHPGVVLAVLSTAGAAPGIRALPATVLSSLPPPLSLAFGEFISAKPGVLCGDKAVVGLAQMAMKGNLNVEELTGYLSEDTTLRLRALAKLFAFEERRASNVLELLLNHPNIHLNHELIQWGTLAKLTKWEELGPNDQLFLLAGLIPAKELMPSSIVQLLAHPSAHMRQFAIEKTIDKVSLAHPSAVPAMNYLHDRPDTLSGKMTLEFAGFLEQPEKVVREKVERWLQGNPPRELLEIVVLGTADGTTVTPFDSILSVYLQSHSWDPSPAVLRKLSHHPEDANRMFAYTKLTKLGKTDPQTALEILTAALASEKRADFKSNLELNIRALRGE